MQLQLISPFIKGPARSNEYEISRGLPSDAQKVGDNYVPSYLDLVERSTIDQDGFKFLTP